MKRKGNELWAILAGIATAYLFQLTLVTFVWLESHELPFDFNAFVPMWTIQLAIAPLTAWIYFGLFGVTWQKKWKKITEKACSFIVPFTIIFSLMLFVLPTALQIWQFWVANALLSLVAAFTVCHNLFDKLK